mgnify:CR=1 FL=1
METSKKWYQSKTLWCAVAVSAFNIATVLGVQVPEVAINIINAILGTTIVATRATASQKLEV